MEETFRFSDYDCVGFDLDNTLLGYNVTNMVRLEYDALSRFMVERRGYDADYLRKPLGDEGADFMQKGLFLDFDRGNVLRISGEGVVTRASHGTKLLSVDEIEKTYPGRKWEATDAFVERTVDTWNGPMSLKFRCLLDYFDMPSALVFARAVDAVDAKNGPPQRYDVWRDVLDGLCDMFDGANFATGEGNYFPRLREAPSSYLRRCDTDTVSWLERLKTEKITFLLTGSFADFADFTASYALGENWRSLFDIVICNAKKPGFFTESRPFIAMRGHDFGENVAGAQLARGEIYSQGNWKELKEFMGRIGKNETPKCLYVGDNLIQDIFVPKAHAVDCDTVVVSEELRSEGIDGEDPHPDEKILNSNYWGSYFSLNDGGDRVDSVWTRIIEKYSKICIPSVETIAKHSIDEPYACFDDYEKKRKGYYPTKPRSLSQ